MNYMISFLIRKVHLLNREEGKEVAALKTEC
jgi:hypothetical protein